jgi:hypothetical protein
MSDDKLVPWTDRLLILIWLVGTAALGYLVLSYVLYLVAALSVGGWQPPQ